MDIKEIYDGAEKLINQYIKKESTDQGHYLTGAMEDSLSHRVKKQGRAYTMEGFGVHYAQYVNEGVPAESASMKQFPFIKRYFQQRGLGEKEAGAAAAATIRKWMKEGMSTQASKRFSSTGARQHFVESAIVGNESKIDEYMSNSFDFSIDETFHKTKSETV